jgi:hypothetical protein
MNQAQFWTSFVLASLATWRVTHLLSHEDGPADAIVRLRAALGESVLGQLMDCFKCLSLWVAAPAALFVTRVPLDWLLVWLALSGAACLLQAVFFGLDDPQSTRQPYPESSSHVLWSQTQGSENADKRASCAEAPDPPYANRGASW